MNNAPKVSIIVPVYNSEKYLNQCVDSIVAQTLTDIEVILVDDGSTDNSPAICDGYAAKDPRIKVIHKKNEGMGIAYNTGMTAAKGEYIGFVESDDWIEPEMYEELYSKVGEEDVDVVKSLYSTSNEGATPVPTKSAIQPKFFDKRVCNAVCISGFMYGHASIWSAIYRRDFIESNKIGFPTTPSASFQDMVFNWLVFCKMKSCYVLPRAFYNYRISPNQSVQRGSKAAKWVLDAHKQIQQQIIRDNVSPRLIEVYMRFLVFSFRNTWNRKDRLHFWNRYFFAKDVSILAQTFIGQVMLLQLPDNEKEILKQLISSPFLFSIRSFLHRKVFSPLKEESYFLGIPVRKKIKSPQCTKVYYFGVPCYIKKRVGTRTMKYVFGIRREVKETKAAQELRMLRAACYANSIAATHQRYLAKYKGCHRGQDVMIVACGPTVNYAPVLQGVKYVAVNRAITIDRFEFDYCFMIDYPSVRTYIEQTYNYGCVNFFGAYICDRSQYMSIPESIAEKAHAERFYTEVPLATHAYFDIEHFPLTDFGTIVHPALSFLFYTRPRRIYLAGCDTSSNGYFEKGVVQGPIDTERLKIGYRKLEEIRNHHYPDIEIISINPIGLKGMFRDMYTPAFLAEHPEIHVEENCIIKGN